MTQLSFMGGAWSMESEGAGLFSIVAGVNGDTVVAEHVTGPDARLIASAPDLYAALLAVLPFVETRWSHAAIDAVTKARAALAGVTP